MDCLAALSKLIILHVSPESSWHFKSSPMQHTGSNDYQTYERFYRDTTNITELGVHEVVLRSSQYHKIGSFHAQKNDQELLQMHRNHMLKLTQVLEGFPIRNAQPISLARGHLLTLIEGNGLSSWFETCQFPHMIQHTYSSATVTLKQTSYDNIFVFYLRSYLAGVEPLVPGCPSLRFPPPRLTVLRPFLRSPLSLVLFFCSKCTRSYSSPVLPVGNTAVTIETAATLLSLP